MEDFLINLLGNFQGPIAYLAVFLVLVICGLGVPLPEDITLIAGGYLAHKGAADLSVMMVVGFLGILVGDSLIYAAGRRLGTRVGSKPGGFFARIVTPEKRAKVEGLFAKHGQKVVMIARFLPGVRAVTYFTAGSAGMNYGRFIFWDGLAALGSAPIFIWLGFHFGGELSYLIDKLKDGQVVVFGSLAVIAVAFFVYSRRRAAAARAQQAAVPAVSPALVGDGVQAPQDAAQLFDVPERSGAARAELRK